MKLMTVKDYAKMVGKSIPLIYKQIGEGKLQTDLKYGRILVKVKDSQIPVAA